MIQQTEAILDICEEYGIKTTIFFEALEYLKIKEEWEKGNRMGYKRNPVQAIEDQIQQAALNGHDIQLHLHPQWVGASWQRNGWKLNMGNWRLGDFTYPGCTIEQLLEEGKTAVEELVRNVIPDYRCSILRAGSYNIMPSGEVFKAMRKTGLKADSSIYPGGYEWGKLSRYDYRNVPHTKDYCWGDESDLRKEGEAKEIMEIPVFALPQRRIHKLLSIDKIKSLLFKKQRKMSSVAREKMESRSLREKLRFLFGKEAFTWDFCLFSKHLHKKYFRYIEKYLSKDRNTFVIIDYPKSFQSGRSLEALIYYVEKSYEKYNFKSLIQVFESFK